MVRKAVIALLWVASLVGVGAAASARGEQAPHPATARFDWVSGKGGEFSVVRDTKTGECYVIYTTTQGSDIAHTTPGTCN
jgi:hypothetical protein